MKRYYLSFSFIFVLCFCLLMRFGSCDVFAASAFPSGGDFLRYTVFNSDTDETESGKSSFSYSNNSSVVYCLGSFYDSKVLYSDPERHEVATVFYSSDSFTPSTGSTFNFNHNGTILKMHIEYNIIYSDHDNYSNFNYSYLRGLYYYNSSTSSLTDVINSALNGSITPDYGSNTYDSSLGYLMNIKCDNQTTTYTNGGKDWTNIISYDQLTSTGFDVTTSGARVEYFFILSGSSGNAFGFGNTTNKMNPYTSQAYTTTGTSFTYNSDLWRSMYESWISQNNLSSTERVKQAHLTIAAHVVYNGSFGDWVKINEDGSSYLITSSQPFEGTEDPKDISVSIGSSSNVTNTQNGNEIVGTYDQISSGDVDVSQLTGAIRIFVDGGQAFIGLFRTYFSWLPDWVIGFVSLSVAIWAIMIVKRAILG